VLKEGQQLIFFFKGFESQRKRKLPHYSRSCTI